MAGISDVVRDSSGALVSRFVRLHRRDTGAVLGETLSNPTTGAYSITTSYAGETYVLAFDTVSGNPFMGNLVLGMHMDGANGGTTFTDVKGKTVTPTSTTTSTTRSMFGGASALFNGSTSKLSIPAANGADFTFGTGAFTVRAWVYIAANSATDSGGSKTAALVNSGYPSGGAITSGWGVSIDGNGSTTGVGITLSAWNAGVQTIARCITTISQGAWHLIELGRPAGGNVIIFLDGVAQTLTTNTIGTTVGVNSNTTNPTLIGQSGYAGYIDCLDGNIDDVEIYKGVCLNTANYTLPASAFLETLTGGTENLVGLDRLVPV